MDIHRCLSAVKKRDRSSIRASLRSLRAYSQLGLHQDDNGGKGLVLMMEDKINEVMVARTVLQSPRTEKNRVVHVSLLPSCHRVCSTRPKGVFCFPCFRAFDRDIPYPRFERYFVAGRGIATPCLPSRFCSAIYRDYVRDEEHESFRKRVMVILKLVKNSKHDS